jgi:phosphatidylglycerophosphatase A
MPVELKEIVEFIKNMGYEVKEKDNGKSVVDELLGAFEEAVPEKTTSTTYLKKLKESGYGKY